MYENPGGYTAVETKALKLKIEMVVAQAIFDQKMTAVNWDYEEFVHKDLNQIVRQLKVWFATQDLESIKVPATWWDHLKLTLFGPYITETLGWLGLRDPKMKVVGKIRAAYPEYPIESLGKPYIYIQRLEV